MNPKRLWLSTLRSDRRECADALRDCWHCDYYSTPQFKEEVIKFKKQWHYLFLCARIAWDHLPEETKWLYEAYCMEGAKSEH